MTSEQSAVDSYEYDANGNMICRVENGVTYSQAYNAENRIASIAKRTGGCTTGTILESWSFAYDGDGVRVMTAHFTGTSGTPDSTTSYFMGGQYELKDGAVKKYYSIAGMTVAVNDGTGVQYLLTDHLGSTVAVTNQAGTLTSQQRYLPFGEPRTIPNSPITQTDFTYTGQRMLDSGMGGVMDYKARFYSPALMRFLQPDTVIPAVENPQGWNRYSYTVNNPIKYSDPSGHCFTGAVVDTILCAAVAGTLIGGAVNAIIQYHETGKVDLKEVAGSAAAGATAAVLLTVLAPASVPAAFVAGGVANVVGNQVGALTEGALNTDSGESFWGNYADAGGIYDGQSVINLDKAALDFTIGGVVNAGAIYLRHIGSKYFFIDDPLERAGNYNPVEFKYNGNGVYTTYQQPLASNVTKSAQAVLSENISNAAWDIMSEYSEQRIERKISPTGLLQAY